MRASPKGIFDASANPMAWGTPLSGTANFGTGNDYKCLSGLSSSFATALFPSIGYDPVSVEPPADYPWEWLKRMLGIFRRALHGQHDLPESIHGQALFQNKSDTEVERASTAHGQIIHCAMYR